MFWSKKEEKDPAFIYWEDVEHHTPESFFKEFFKVDTYLKENPFVTDETNYEKLVSIIRANKKMERLAITGWLIQNLALLPAFSCDEAFGENIITLTDEGLPHAEKYFEILKGSVSHLPPYFYADMVKSITMNPEAFEKEEVAFAKALLKESTKA